MKIMTTTGLWVGLVDQTNLLIFFSRLRRMLYFGLTKKWTRDEIRFVAELHKNDEAKKREVIL